jgi:hypothetical protein
MTTRGIEHAVSFAGLDAIRSTVASNSGTIFSGLPSLCNHSLPGVTANSVLADLRTRVRPILVHRARSEKVPSLFGRFESKGIHYGAQRTGGFASLPSNKYIPSRFRIGERDHDDVRDLEVGNENRIHRNLVFVGGD